jgi:hypothetical protein
LWLVYRLYVDQGLEHANGVGAAISWVRNHRRAPVTGRQEAPVTPGLAEVEMWAAAVAADDGTTVVAPTRELWARHRVAWRTPPRGLVHEYAVGVYSALRWLTGPPDGERPVPVPVRNPDGTVMSAEDVYRQTVQLSPDLFGREEQRIELWQWAIEQARIYEVWDALIADTRRRVATKRGGRAAGWG